MKKYIALLGAALVMGTAAQAKDIQDLRIYINPGHGGWSTGDRALGTVKHGDPVFDSSTGMYKDTTNFYETNTNTWKGLAMLQRLSEYGFKYDPTLNQKPEGAEDVLYRWGAARDMSQGLVMSHVKNGVSRNINEIAIEVEANNFDFFMSIHSNAHVDGNNTNYPALFIRGENKTESSPGSANACRTIWPFAYSNQHSCWSNYSMSNVALYYDIDFWNGDYAITDHGNGNLVKGYYAVLRHNVPGLLCEGYFHTYQPARHRAMNPDVCKLEGEAYARGIASIFNVQTEKTGDLYGIVRDLHERFKHKYYNASSASRDSYMPLNNVKVELLKDGQVVRTYTTDDEYNGAFIFRQVEPGTYTINVKAEGYKDADPDMLGPFEIKASEVTYCNVDLENEAYEPPAVIYTDYTDELVDEPAFNAAPRYNFTQAVADKEIAQLADKKVKRMIAKGNNIYVLAHDTKKAPTLLVLDATTLDVKAEVSTEGTEGSECDLCDIGVTADGILIGTAAELNHIADDYVDDGETRGEMWAYKWANDENGVPAGEPQKWFMTQVTANFYKAYAGFTFAYTGTIDEGQMYLPAASWYGVHNIWLNVIDINEGTVSTSRFVNSTREHMNLAETGDDVTITLDPNNTGRFIANSSNIPAIVFDNKLYELIGTAEGNLPAREGYFKYSGKSYMVSNDIDADGKHAGVILTDITAGATNPKTVATTNTAIDAIEGDGASAGRTVVTRDADYNVTAADIDLYTLRGNKINRFTTAGTEQPTFRGNWAYGLGMTTGDNEAELSFSLTGDASAFIRLTATADNTQGEKNIEVGRGEYTKGENSVKVNLADLEGSYTWEVVVENEAIPGVGKLFEGEYPVSGTVMDMNPESDNFGVTYQSRYHANNANLRGICKMAPDYTELVDYMSPLTAGVWDTSVGASPWRLALLPSGNLLISDWSDKHGGIYRMDTKTNELSNFFAGTITPSSGEWKYEGATLGGSTSGMAVTGTGDQTVLYTFQEDWPSDYSLNMVQYNLGTRELVDFQPVQNDNFKTVSSYLINGNVEVLHNQHGLVLGQVRGSGNNTKGVPSFLVTDPEGKILYNSGTDWESLTGSTGGFALSQDGSTFVIEETNSNFIVARIEWEPEFKLTPLYKFTSGAGNNTTYQAFFDPAGNIVLGSRYGTFVYALPRDARQTSTPAKAEYLLNGKEAVEGITVDKNTNDAPVRYYNLQGIEIGADNMAPGVYIRQQGNTTTKTVVK